MTPCRECPWRRSAAPGWLGSETVAYWLRAAHSDCVMMCHIRAGQCTGAAIYRANVAKLPRDPKCLRMPRDTETVFAGPVEFQTYHEQFKP